MRSMFVSTLRAGRKTATPSKLVGQTRFLNIHEYVSFLQIYELPSPLIFLN